jgi:TonB dependent receptor
LIIFPARDTSMRLTATHARQTGSLQSSPQLEALPVTQSFWLFDLSAEYRIPGRRGIVSLGGSNLLNQNIGGYQDPDAANPRFARGRLLFGRFILQF